MYVIFLYLVLVTLCCWVLVLKAGGMRIGNMCMYSMDCEKFDLHTQLDNSFISPNAFMEHNSGSRKFV